MGVQFPRPRQCGCAMGAMPEVARLAEAGGRGAGRQRGRQARRERWGGLTRYSILGVLGPGSGKRCSKIFRAWEVL